MNRRARPYLMGNHLVVPLACPTRYHWWDDTVADTLTVHEILVELDAPQRVHLAYCGRFQPCSGVVLPEPAPR